MGNVLRGLFSNNSRTAALRVIYGTDMTEEHLKMVYEIDKLVYTEELQGEYKNLKARFNGNRDTFICVMVGEELVGYINFFPVGEALREELLDPEHTRIRDDDITPEELASYSKEDDNHIFIISVAVHPNWRGGDVTKLLGKSFARYIAQKHRSGYEISGMSGAVVSGGGRRFLSYMHFVPYKPLEDGYELYVCGGKNIEELIRHG